MEVHIIGGGINGLCTAYFLQKNGHQVTIIDPAFSEEGTSYGNAGMIVPSHFIPMASPGVITQGIKWMFNSKSPFYIKPRMDLDLLQWLWKFYRSCTHQNVERTKDLIWNYNEWSKTLYREIVNTEQFEVDFQEKGLLMLYKSEKARLEELSMAEQARKLGLKVDVLDAEEVQRLNPETEVSVLGGIYFPDDAHIYSNAFMQKIKQHLKALGVLFLTKKIHSFQHNRVHISGLKCSDGSMLPVKNLVIAAGAWTGELLKKIQVNLPLQDGKGYSVTLRNHSEKPTIPSILTHERIAITPMGNHLRITGTLEISGKSKAANLKRVSAFLSAVPQYFPEVVPENTSKENIWVGYRPLSPDGVPYVGRLKSFNNVIIATGHGMMGMSLGPATGKIVANIIEEKPMDLDLKLMNPERF